MCMTEKETESCEISAFRHEVRDWISANIPKSLIGVDQLLYQGSAKAAAQSADFQTWRNLVADKGWGVPTWPKQYGGCEFDKNKAAVIVSELAAAKAINPIRSYGTMMLGPTLLEFGTEEQKAEHLPPISRHERRWCQGFSEPGAGSDLASLQMKCVDDGDNWLVNGQKIWTSGADEADWCFALVRTDNNAKHNGISFLLIDMKSEGIEVRPIVLISGSTHFCEVFFNDVKVPKGNIVGGLNKGWGVAKRLLQFERESISVGRGDIPSLAPIAKKYVGTDENGRILDFDLRARLIRNGLRASAFGLTVRRLAQEAKSANGPNVGGSAIKNLWSDIAQENAELLIEIKGSHGLGWSENAYEKAELAATRAWLHSKAFSIYGGSHEVQNNIVAKRVLELPSE